MRFLIFLSAGLLAGAAQAAPTLRYDPAAGVILSTAEGTACLDSDGQARGPVVRFLPEGGTAVLARPAAEHRPGGELRLRYHIAGPGGVTVEVVREITLRRQGRASEVVEQMRLTPAQPLAQDVEIERPFLLPSGPAQAVLPLKNGWARRLPLAAAPQGAEYRLGASLAPALSELALPVVQLEKPGAWRAALCADPTFSALFTASESPRGITGCVRYRYAGSRVPLKGTETRSFALRLAPARTGEPFGDAVDAFFRLMLPDVPAGPRWLHDIAMVDYDYLSDGGQGWERDVRALTGMLRPEERRHVCLCFHGWYDTLGTYCYDAAKGCIRPEWVAMARTRKVALSQEEVRRRLRLARSLGFRVVMYFGDGLLQDSKTPGYRPEWDYQDAAGRKIGGWQGPDTWGATYARNPANREVVRWYAGYLAALLKAFGRDVDGFVWDETFYIGTGFVAAKPDPAYADRAMLALVRALAQQVHAFDPQKAFLSSDDVGLGGASVPSYAMVAHGTYQDSWCHPSAWSFGLFPNWRNTLWSCNWSPLGNFPFTRWGVQQFGTPVAISNGWGDDRGPSEWQPWERDGFLRLFRERLAQKERVRFLTDDPAKLLADGPQAPSPSDAIPEPAPGEQNWALAQHGSRASASSEDDYGGGKWGPAGLIDGVRDDTGWGAGHGWASKRGQPLPQWAEVDLGRPRRLSRFVVITYQHEKSEETASKWGVLEYDIQVRTPAGWHTVVQEHRGSARKARVHVLPAPVVTDAFRIVVNRVAPLDGQARLLQVEAWGE